MRLASYSDILVQQQYLPDVRVIFNIKKPDASVIMHQDGRFIELRHYIVMVEGCNGGCFSWTSLAAFPVRLITAGLTLIWNQACDI